MKHILYLGGFELPDKNAAAQRVMAIGKTLREMDYRVTFVGVSKERKSDITTYEEFECHSLPYPKSTKQWLRHIWKFIPQEKLEAHHPNYVILYNFPAIASMKILNYCHKIGIKVFHDTTEWELTGGHSLRNIIKNADTQWRMKHCLQKMDGVITISRYLYDRYHSKVNTILIPPTVDLKAEKWKRNRELTAGEVVKLVYAGSAGLKNKDRLDRVVEVVSRMENIELTVVGLTEVQYVTTFGEIPEGCQNVMFMGRVSHHEAVQAVQEADFQVMIRDDTLKNRAGFPTKFVESISCCTPLITTLSSNIGDYLFDGHNGFVVDDKHPLSEVIEKVAKLSVEERVRMKRYCRENNSFDYHHYTEELKKLFA